MRKIFFPPFKRDCPECGISLTYTNSKNRNQAENKKKLCHKCSSKNRVKTPEEQAAWNRNRLKRKYKKEVPPFTRNCPKCNKELTYTNVKNKNKANRAGKICRKCSSIEVGSRTEVKDRLSRQGKLRVGSKNSFFGKHHSEETKEKIRKIDRSYTQTEEFRKNSARPGKKNGMYGKSVYDVWIKKYGKKEADEKQLILNRKRSEQMSGKNNNMYGKPSPTGSGGGWGGWYKGWYFRSLRELSYMINVIEKNKYEWESTETKQYAIPYKDFDGRERTYRPDFIINKTILLEIKPKKLMDTPTNTLKKEAALKFCEGKGLEYHMVDVKILDKTFLKELVKNKIVKLNKKYEKRLKCN